MRNNFTWIFFLILSCAPVRPLPMMLPVDVSTVGTDGAQNLQHSENVPGPSQEQVISVSITSSVAVGRGNGKLSRVHKKQESPPTSLSSTIVTQSITSAATEVYKETVGESETMTTMATALAGANLEFIKQLHSKKEARGLQHFERVHTFPSNIENQYSNNTDDSIAEPSVKSVLEFEIKNDEIDESIENIPLARSVPHSPSLKNHLQSLTGKQISARGNNQRLTTVSFNIVHDSPKVTANYNAPDILVTPERSADHTSKYYNEPPKFYNEPAKVYGQPAQIYSEPAKYYSEPAKIYSEPAKVYSEPAKIYSEPSKIYSEPAKFYSEPASLHLVPGSSDRSAWQQNVGVSTTVVTTTPYTTVTIPSMLPNSARVPAEHQPEKNYEVDEKVSVRTDGRSHGVQESSTESCKQENCKVGYVVEGRQYRKYRVEERTSDGFIVGEYGVVRNEDGALRGVRYTADSAASPRLIYDALMKFLQLK